MINKWNEQFTHLLRQEKKQDIEERHTKIVFKIKNGKYIRIYLNYTGNVKNENNLKSSFYCTSAFLKY